MRGRVVGKSTNTYEVWVADSGTSVSIVPINIAERNGIGTQLTILGQTNIWIKFSTMKKAQEISALVCQE